jgi:hypothetical protein
MRPDVISVAVRRMKSAGKPVIGYDHRGFQTGGFDMQKSGRIAAGAAAAAISATGVLGLSQGAAQAAQPAHATAHRAPIGVSLRVQFDAGLLRSGQFKVWLKDLIRSTDGRKPKPGGYRPLGN